MNIKKIKDGNYAGKTYTVSYEDIVDAAEAIISSVGFEYRDLQDFKANVNLVLPADVVDGAVKEAYRNSKKNVSDSRVSDDDDAFDEYFDYSEESMEENDKVNDKCGGKRKVGDARRVSDYAGQAMVSQYYDAYQEMAQDILEVAKSEGGLSINKAKEMLEDVGLVEVEYGGGQYGDAYACYAFEDDDRFGDYGNAGACIMIEYDNNNDDMLITDVYACE